LPRRNDSSERGGAHTTEATDVIGDRGSDRVERRAAPGGSSDHAQDPDAIDTHRWYGIFAGAKLSGRIVEAVKSPEVVQRLAADGSTAVGSSQEQFSAHLNAEMVKWRRVLQDTGLTLSGAKPK
jgi:hypothetical protein